MPTVRKQYGPTVKCTFTGDLATTHRPGNSGPFFCMNCGDTDHAEVDYRKHFAGKREAAAELIVGVEETTAKTEESAHRLRRIAINLGAAVSLVAFDATRNLYAFDITASAEQAAAEQFRNSPVVPVSVGVSDSGVTHKAGWLNSAGGINSRCTDKGTKTKIFLTDVHDVLLNVSTGERPAGGVRKVCGRCF